MHNGALIFLKGDLGSGKTTFTKALIREILPEAKVKSPTYTYIQNYSDNIYHLDLYRVDNLDVELEGLLLEICVPSNLVLVEWPEIAQNILPQPNFTVEFTYLNDEEREIKITEGQS